MATKQKKTVRSVEDLDTDTFDISKYLISSELETRILVIPETGDEIEVEIRPIPWSKRNKIISECLKWQDGGQVDFDGDRYVKACLSSMVVKAPWGATDEKFLSAIDARLGGVLEELVPKAFGEDQANTVETLKKG